jgi:hypothetical protein
MTKKLLRMPLILASLLFAAACEQPAGTGNPPSAITLGSAGELAKIGVDPGYPLDGSYTLGKDLTLTDWTPIGTADEPFAGTFDGKGKTLNITGSGGLFGFAEGATILNLTVTGTINASGSGMVFAGGIVGRGEKTNISSCVSGADIAVEAHGHNSSAGGIAGLMTDHSAIADCDATGKITLQSGKNEGLMLYAGGIAGYQGLAGSSGDGFGGCVIERCSFAGSVTTTGGYPYAGGIVGYNYVGSQLRESYAVGPEGSVRAIGEVIPYAGGVSGYNSRSALIENCYSDIGVSAEASSKQALAGGISGANAAGSAISKCYALGALAATVDGSGDDDSGGSIGVPAAASAGGIAGAQYVDAPSLKNCVALNRKIEGRGSGAAYNVHRIAGPGTSGDLTWEANIAYVAEITKGGDPANPSSEPNGHDGRTCEAKPAQSSYEALGWDFASVWEMGDSGYPVLQWRRP